MLAAGRDDKSETCHVGQPGQAEMTGTYNIFLLSFPWLRRSINFAKFQDRVWDTLDFM